MIQSKKIPGAVFVLFASFLWGTTGTVQALAPTNATPIAVGTIRIIIGSVALYILLQWKGIRLKDYKWPIKPLALAALGMAANNLFFFAGVSKTGVAVGTIVTIGSSPILAGLIGWIVYQETINSRWLISTILALFGGALLMLSLLFFVDLTWLKTPQDWRVALHLGVITIAAAFTLYAYGLKTLLAPKAVTLTLAEPLTASTLASFF